MTQSPSQYVVHDDRTTLRTSIDAVAENWRCAARHASVTRGQHTAWSCVTSSAKALPGSLLPESDCGQLTTKRSPIVVIHSWVNTLQLLHLGSPGKRAVKRVCVCPCHRTHYFLLIRKTTNRWCQQFTSNLQRSKDQYLTPSKNVNIPTFWQAKLLRA